MTTVPAIPSPTRTCAGCGCRDAQAAMIRLRLAGGVLGPSGCRGTGRSAYVHDRSDCVRGLVKSRLLGKSLRANVAREARLTLVERLEERSAARDAATQADSLHN